MANACLCVAWWSKQRAGFEGKKGDEFLNADKKKKQQAAK